MRGSKKEICSSFYFLLSESEQGRLTVLDSINPAVESRAVNSASKPKKKYYTVRGIEQITFIGQKLI